MKLRIRMAIALSLIFANLVGAISVASAHLIIQARGRVSLQRETSDYSRPTNVGESLEDEDSLIPRGGAKVRVLCDNGNIESVIAGEPHSLKSICSVKIAGGPGITTRETLEIPHKPGGSNPQIPYTLNPRMTYLLGDKPLIFRWNKLASGIKYTVRLCEPGWGEWKKTEVSATELVYDGDPLERGAPYLLTIKAENNGKSSLEDSGGNLGFELLEQDDFEYVKNKENEIKELSDLNKEEKDLALAALYSYEYLITDAIEKLKNFDNPGSYTAFVYRWLGDLYTGAGLNLKAQEYYSKSIELFTDPQDLYELEKAKYELAQAKTGQAGVMLMLGQRDEAEQLSSQAKAIYQDLEYSEMVTEMEKRLEKLEKEWENEVDREDRGCESNIVTPTMTYQN